MSDQTEREDELARLRQWKAEATEVILGLQDVGKALKIRPGERITGTVAAETARRLTTRAESAEARVRELEAALQQSRDDHQGAVEKLRDEVERLLGELAINDEVYRFNANLARDAQERADRAEEKLRAVEARTLRRAADDLPTFLDIVRQDHVRKWLLDRANTLASPVESDTEGAQ
jgi:predicted transcriptional regulator